MLAAQNLIQQPANVGVSRGLNTQEQEHIICLLRAVERLPILSEIASGTQNTCCQEAYDSLCRCLQGIHQNHLELSRYAAMVLTPSPCTNKSTNETDSQ